MDDRNVVEGRRVRRQPDRFGQVGVDGGAPAVDGRGRRLRGRGAPAVPGRGRRRHRDEDENYGDDGEEGDSDDDAGGARGGFNNATTNGRLAIATRFGHVGTTAATKKLAINGGRSDFAISRKDLINFDYAFVNGQPKFSSLSITDKLVFSRAFATLPDANAHFMALADYHKSHMYNAADPERVKRLMSEFLGELVSGLASAWDPATRTLDDTLMPSYIEFTRGPSSSGDYLNPDKPSPGFASALILLISSIANDWSGGVMAPLVIKEIDTSAATRFMQGLINNDGTVRTTLQLDYNLAAIPDITRIERLAITGMSDQTGTQFSFDNALIRSAIFNRRVEKEVDVWLRTPIQEQVEESEITDKHLLNGLVMYDYNLYNDALQELVAELDTRVSQPGSLLTAATKKEVKKLFNQLNSQFMGLYSVRARMLSILTSQIKATVREPFSNHFLGAGEPGTGKTETSTIMGKLLGVLGLITPPDVEKLVQAFSGALSRLGDSTREEYRRKYAESFEKDAERRAIYSSLFPGVAEEFLVTTFNKTQPFYGQVYKISPDQLVGAYTGQTEQRVEEAVLRTIGGVLIIDEAQTAMAKKTDGPVILNAINTAITEFGTSWSSMMMGYEEEIIKMFKTMNPGLESRYTQQLRFGQYKPRELTAILFKKVADRNRGLLSLLVRGDFPNVGKPTHAEYFDKLMKLNDKSLRFRIRLSLNATQSDLEIRAQRVIIKGRDVPAGTKLDKPDVAKLKKNLFGTGNARSITAFLLWTTTRHTNVVPVQLHASDAFSFQLHSAANFISALKSNEVEPFSGFVADEKGLMSNEKPVLTQMTYQLRGDLAAAKTAFVASNKEQWVKNLEYSRIPRAANPLNNVWKFIRMTGKDELGAEQVAEGQTTTPNSEAYTDYNSAMRKTTQMDEAFHDGVKEQLFSFDPNLYAAHPPAAQN